MLTLGPLADGELHVWHGRARPETPYPDWASLSLDERARWRLLPARKAASFAASHAALRMILGRYLGTFPALVQLSPVRCPVCGRNAKGRPVVRSDGRPLWFSLSHSGEHWVVAVSRHPVGVDVENEREVDVDALSGIALTAAEFEAIDGQDPIRRAEYFYRAWTRKEAVFRACGGFPLADLRHLDARPHEAAEVVLDSPSRTWPQRWRVQNLPVGDTGHAAVASPAEINITLQHREWNPDARRGELLAGVGAP